MILRNYSSLAFEFAAVIASQDFGYLQVELQLLVFSGEGIRPTEGGGLSRHTPIG